MGNMLQNKIYNYFVTPFTTNLYTKFYEKEKEKSTILDIGVGNCEALIGNKKIILDKDLQILGVDIDEDAINRGRTLVIENGLSKNVSLRCADVYKMEQDRKYDTVVFSDSWAVIPDVQNMVTFAHDNFLKNNGKVVVLTTLEDQPSRVRQILKPRIKYFLGKKNDFGRCTTLQEMSTFVSKFTNQQLELVRSRTLPFYGQVKTYYVSFK